MVQHNNLHCDHWPSYAATRPKSMLLHCSGFNDGDGLVYGDFACGGLACHGLACGGGMWYNYWLEGSERFSWILW